VGALVDEKFNSATLGTKYLPSQNVSLELFVIKESGSGVDALTNERDQTWMMQLFAGF
jgi:hypothetical protein